MKKSYYLIAVLIMICAAIISTCILVKEISLTPHMIPKWKSETGQTLQININTATVEELKLLTSVSDDLAQRIIAYRQENGPFHSVEEIMSVEGIGQVTFNSISPYLTVGG